jgi:hypothetical protein
MACITEAAIGFLQPGGPDVDPVRIARFFD